MRCRSGNGLMSYGYSFIQIGGHVGDSNDDVKSSELWDGDYKKGDTAIDCRIKCTKISKTELKKIIKSFEAIIANNLKDKMIINDFMGDVYEVKISNKLELIPKTFIGNNSIYPDDFNGDFSDFFEVVR